MFCPQCGQQLPVQANYCTACGHPTSSDSTRSHNLHSDSVSHTNADFAAGVAFRPLPPADLPFAVGSLCALNSAVYEVSYDANTGCWQLEDVTDFRKNLLVESDGSLSETRFDEGLSTYKTVGSTGYTTADLKPYIVPWNWRDDPIRLLPPLFQAVLAALIIWSALSVAISGDYYLESNSRWPQFAYLSNKIGDIFGTEGVVVLWLCLALALAIGAWQSFIQIRDAGQ